MATIKRIIFGKLKLGVAPRVMAIVLSLILLQGCTATGALIGAGAAVATKAAEDRGFRGALSDTGLEAEISHLWFQHDESMFQKLSITVYEGRVLITGSVPTDQMRYEAIRLAWQPEEVTEVINEIHVGKDTNFQQVASDIIIANKLRGLLLLNGDVKAINYNLEVVSGTVYLIGIARTRGELNLVIEEARNISGVRNVISHVRIATESSAPVPRS